VPAISGRYPVDQILVSSYCVATACETQEDYDIVVNDEQPMADRLAAFARRASAPARQARSRMDGGTRPRYREGGGF